MTCLVCDTKAYRVKTEVTPDADAKEGPVLPTEEWAERDTLMSRVGFVDVHVGTGGCVVSLIFLPHFYVHFGASVLYTLHAILSILRCCHLMLARSVSVAQMSHPSWSQEPRGSPFLNSFLTQIKSATR